MVRVALRYGNRVSRVSNKYNRSVKVCSPKKRGHWMKFDQVMNCNLSLDISYTIRS